MKRWLRDAVGIAIGAILSAIALNMFLIPNKIAAGGITGLATIFHYLFNWPVGLTSLAMNVPLFLLGVKLFGKRYGLNTLYGAIVLSLAIDGLEPFIPVLTHDSLLACLYGGVIDGIGLALVFKFNGTTAGTDLGAAILSRIIGISVGQALLSIDFFVIAFAGFAFAKAELALYALITLVVATQLIDLIQEGRSSARAFLIMTDHSSEIGAAIMAELGRGVTYLSGRGAFTGQERDVVLCVVSINEVSPVKEILHKIDPAAFVIVTDAHDVMGEGFGSIKDNT
ncbi:MAG: YitT family protein [Sporomusaceae bacterium]|nr:YitT family protein [Sporomusaceae bacterium]